MGRLFDRHPLALRALAVIALAWGLAYLGWRVGWSSPGSSPIAFGMLLATEIYGLWARATVTWYSWSRPPAVRPPATPGRSVDVYVCTYDEPVEVVAATLTGCRALTYPHTTWLLDDGRRPEMRELARTAGARYLARPDNSHAKAGNIKRGAAPHRCRTCADARRRPRADARRPGRPRRLLRRRAGGLGPEPA